MNGRGHVILTNGLGGDHLGLLLLIAALKSSGYECHWIDHSGITSHKDRVSRIENLYWKLRSQYGGKIFILGQSAGGSASQMAADAIEKAGGHIDGLILLNPALPKGILFGTVSLAVVMCQNRFRCIRSVLGNRNFNLTPSQFERLAGPFTTEVSGHPLPISGQESLDLLFGAHHLKVIQAPILFLHAGKDYWLGFRPHRAHVEKLRKMGNRVEAREFRLAGHLLLDTLGGGPMVAQVIIEWLSAR